MHANWQAKLHSFMLEAHGVYSETHVYSTEEIQFNQRERISILSNFRVF